LFVAGRYRLDRLVGEGGMSWVWAATNVITARPVALKFLKRPAARATDRFRRFLEEARATIPHRNVVHIYDLLYLEGDVPFIVMELLRGGTLRDELRRKGRLSLEAACGVLGPVVSALGSAHAAGIIHCDLKSENIFLAREDDGELTVKVLDFGLAKQLAMDITEAAGPVSRPHRRGSAPFGTVGYAAPEQAISSNVDHRADIWALGVVLFECLTGERPFPSDGWERYLEACSGAAGENLLSEESALRRRVASGLPASVASLIARMLSLDPSRRPSLKEVQAELQRYTAVRSTSFGEPASMRTSGEVIDEESTISESDPILSPEPPRPPETASASNPEPPRAPPPARWARDIAILSAAALLLSGVAGLLFRRSPEPDQAIVPEAPRAAGRPVCKVTITYTLSDLEALADAMPITVKACSGPRNDCARYSISLSPFTCDAVDPDGVGGVKCFTGEIDKEIEIRRKVDRSAEGCDAWKHIEAEVRDKHNEPLRLSLKPSWQMLSQPGPGADEEIVVNGVFER
jgi:serine/threonine-protein kinase